MDIFLGNFLSQLLAIQSAMFQEHNVADDPVYAFIAVHDHIQNPHSFPGTCRNINIHPHCTFRCDLK